jgi:RNA polymerase sigma-70 factor (ECF subfamily)
MDASFTIRLSTLALAAEDETTARALVLADSPDEALLIEVAQGSREALSILFQRYARLVHTVAVRILRDSVEADDLVQEVFIYLARKASDYDSSKCSARSWIVQMTYHRAIDRRRYLDSRHFYTCLDLDEAQDFLSQSSAGVGEIEPLGPVVGKTTIRALLDTLTEDQRHTLSLHFVEGFTFAEIAAKLGQSVGNVRNHYYRGLDKLRKQVFPAKLPRPNGYGRK